LAGHLAGRLLGRHGSSAILTAFSAVLGAILPASPALGGIDPLSTWTLAAGAMAVAVLLAPGLVANILHLRGRKLEDIQVRPLRARQAVLLSGAAGLSMFLGDRLLAVGGWSWLAMPVFYLGAVCLPALTLGWFALGGLGPVPSRRLWSVFSLGLVFGPFIILLAETALLVLLLFGATFLVAIRPDLLDVMYNLGEQMMQVSDPEVILELLRPYLLHPAVIALLLVVVAVCVPLIEELLKPAGVWFLLKRKLSAGEGFILGTASGAGYALFESLGQGATSGDGWGMLQLARVGTSLVHILGSGLVGYALASAWQDKRLLRLLGLYLLAVLNHGLWNAQAALSALGNLAGISPGQPGLPAPWTRFFEAGLGVQAALMAGALVFIRRRLRRETDDREIDV